MLAGSCMMLCLSCLSVKSTKEGDVDGWQDGGCRGGLCKCQAEWTGQK